MTRFGTNLFEQPIFRVVFSDSRTDLIGGRWPDGNCDYREVPRYPDIHAWILERWLTPEAYAGKREDYEHQQLDIDSGLYTCGPYPHRGEYVHCYTFPFEPGDSMVCSIVSAVKRSGYLSPGQRKEAIMGRFDESEKQSSARFDTAFEEALGPWSRSDAVVSFASGPFDRAGFKRASDMPVERFDQAAPLPTQDNFFGTIQKPETVTRLRGD